ncbi:MAG: class I SAM-dependent RNA methyltransferase [Pyrinomonadaceae bacterium]|nr:class I SAM-dependent RNA methyltransferase [Pyrinomonadaceae bacterium]
MRCFIICSPSSSAVSKSRWKTSISSQYKIGETLTVKIEKIVPNGFGLAFAENLTVFVPLSAGGDELRVKINQIKGKTAFAEIVEIIEPSPARVEPRCPYFGRCGGCDFQQLNYAAQLEAKIGIVRDCLSRIGKINYEREIPIIGSPHEYEYRSRAQWHVAARQKKIGYFQRKTHEIIDVEVCPILIPDLEKILTELRETIEWESFWSAMVEIETAAAGGEVSIYSAEIIEPTEEISFTAHGETYWHDATSFFQGNPFLIEQLVEAAVKDANGESALDLYCGVGLFTLPLARKFQKVVGVEGYDKAVDFAEKNVEQARLTSVRFYRENVGDWLNENAANLKNLDFVLLDPPRSGTEKETIENLLKIKPRQISYVSCEPSTLARDLKILTENGYSIESITAFDLFPQTHHVETIVRLKLDVKNTQTLRLGLKPCE